MRGRQASQEIPVPCVMCRSEPAALKGGLEGAGCYEGLAVCSEECRTSSQRLAGLYLVDREPARAGHLVALLGAAAGTIFTVAGRELGGLLLAFSLLAFGTIRLAYPEVLPARWLHRLGALRAIELSRWLGVAACSLAVGGAVWSLVV
jgi:hypothetical protein